MIKRTLLLIAALSATLCAAAQNPTAEEHVAAGDKYRYELGQRENALLEYTKAIELDPTFAKAYYHRGLTYRYFKRYNDAIADLTRAIALDPNDRQIYYYRGYTYHQMKQYNSAIADYTQAIKFALDNGADNSWLALYYRERAYAYSANYQYIEALADYNSALSLIPEWSFAINGRIVSNIKLGRYNAAIEDLNQVLEKTPSSETIYLESLHLWRGQAYNGLKRYREAITEFTLAINSGLYYFENKDKAEFYAGRGHAYFELEQYYNAIADLTRAIALDPNDSLLYLERGEVYEALGRYTAADNDFDKAEELLELGY